MNRRNPLRRSVAARFLLAVVAAGGIAGLCATIAVVAVVRSEDEARLADDVLDRAERAADTLDHRIALGLAKLDALAVTLGTPDSIAAARGLDPLFEAVRSVRDDRALLELARDASVAKAVAGVPVEGPELEWVDEEHVLLRALKGDVTTLAVVDVTTALAPPDGWIVSLDRELDPSGPPIRAQRERRLGEDWIVVTHRARPGFTVRLEAPLAPAQAAAMGLAWRILAWASLGVPLLVVVGWLASLTMTRPLRTLARAVRSAGSGAVEVPAMPPDEIGDVARAVRLMSGRAQEHARVLRSVVRSVRRMGLAPEAGRVLVTLEEALTDAVPSVAWSVASVALVDTVELSNALQVPPGAIGRALARESPIDPSAQQRLTLFTDRPESSLETEPDGTLIVPLQTLGRDFGLVVGRSVTDRRVFPVIELLCATALSRLRRLELGQIVAGQEKRALLGSVLSVLGRTMHSPASLLAANLHVLRAVNDEDAEVLNEAREAAEALFEEVRHLSAFARSASPASLEPIDLSQMLARIRAHALASTPNVPVSVHAPDGLRAVGDPYQTEQSLMLLVKNAQEAVAHAPAPDVVVTASVDGERLVVEVKDNGRGVDEGVRDRLFEPFASTKTREGTGLGLYLARNFARSQGGDVVLLSTGPEGSVFRLTVRADQLPTRGTVRSPARRVLLVDSDESALARLKRWVPSGVQVTAARDTRDALTFVRSFQFDAVVCGLPLVDASPGDLLRSFEELAPGLRGHVLFLESDAASGAVEAGLTVLPWPEASDAFHMTLAVALEGVSDAA